MSFFEKLSTFFNGASEDAQEAVPASAQSTIVDAPIVKSGRTTGELEFDGAADDETVAAILAAVSDFTDIPMNALKITSVKAVQ
jgi:hypothetical protein